MSLFNVAFKPIKPATVNVSPFNDTTHQDLVLKAQSFVKKTCYITCSEIKVLNQIESPDVIGFQSYKSIVIECKRTYEDFRRDYMKPHRKNPAYGMGDTRYYFALSNVIPVHEISNGWGLIEWYAEQNNKLIITKPSIKFYPDKVREHMLLVTIIRRIGEHNENKDFVINKPYKNFQENSVLINVSLKEGL